MTMKTDNNRRSFITRMLTAAGGLAATSLIGRPARLKAESLIPLGSSAAAGNFLRFPGHFTGTEIAARVQTQEVWPGEPIPVWTMGGSYPAPTIRVRKGERFA